MNHPIIDIMERNGELKPNPDCAEARREYVEEHRTVEFMWYIFRNHAWLVDEFIESDSKMMEEYLEGLN